MRSRPGYLGLLLAVGAFCACTSILSAQGPPQVNTSTGPVVGVRLSVNQKSVDAFLGIPFAEPPTGERRFLKPRSVTPWKDVLRTDSHRPGCVQTDFPLSNDATIDASNTTEDCLYLNVWVPARNCTDGTHTCDKEPISVLVYLFGGFFTWGASSLFLYDGAQFASRTCLIFVSFDYRVGVFGFLNSSSSEAPGNMGLYDQVEALRWIHENIQFFGEDPTAITLAGESAGSVSISYHLMSKLSENLFKRAVLMSGTPFTIAFTEGIDHYETFQRVGQLFSCFDFYIPRESQIPAIVNCLRKVNAHEMYRELEKELNFRYINLLPNYGGEFLPERPTDTDNARISAKEVLMGTVLNDGAYIVEQLFSQVPSLGLVDGRTVFISMLRTLYGITLYQGARLAEEYFAGRDSADLLETSKLLSAATTDAGFECATDEFGSAAARNGATVYRYLFTHRPSYSRWPEWVNATHIEEIAFFLGTLRFDNDTLNGNSGKDVRSFSRIKCPRPQNWNSQTTW